LAYLFFVSRIDLLITEIDHHGQQIVELIAGDSADSLRSKRKAA
jgi:hypothetical protein